MASIFPPFSNYWFIAEIIATGEFAQCNYGAGTTTFSHEFSIPPWGSHLDSCFHRLVSSTAQLYQKIKPVGDPPSHFEIQNERSAYWQAHVPEDDSIRLYYGTDFFRVSNGGDTIFDNRMSTDSTFWLGWRDYFESGGLERGCWAVSNIFYVPDPQPPDTLTPPVGEITFEGYIRKSVEGTFIDGVDWRPDPTTHDSMIGIILKTTDRTGEADMRIAYEIFEMTNRYEFNRRHGREPDFTVYNPPKGDKNKYVVTKITFGVRFFISYDFEFEEGQVFAYPRYRITLDEPVKCDTLWLIAESNNVREFVIIPYGLSTYTLRLRPDLSCHNANQPFSIIIPPK